MVAVRTRSSHAGVMSTPYFDFTAAEGKLSKVHMPSSARDVEAASATTSVRTKARVGNSRRANFGMEGSGSLRDGSRGAM